MPVIELPLRGKPPVDKGGEPPYDGGMEHRMTALETRLDTILPMLATKADLAGVSADLSKASVETHKGFSDMVKWIVGTGFVGLAAMVTIMTFVLNNAVPKAPVQQGATQPPIIINVPVPATPPPQTKQKP